MNRFWESIENLIDSPLSTVSGVVTGILSLWGLMEICQVVEQGLGSVAAILTISVLLVVCLIPFVLRYFVLNPERRFSLPTKERFLFTRINRRWRIREDGGSALDTTNTYFFFREPEKEDLFDIVFSSLPFELDSYRPNSTDANPLDREEVKENLWKIYWEPRSGAIGVGEPYEHNFRSDFPPYPGFTSKSLTVAVSVFTVMFGLEIESEVPVYRAYAYRKRWWQRLRDHGSIVRTAQRIKSMKAPPLALVDERHFKWQIKNVKRGDIYYIVLLFKNRESIAEVTA